MARTKNVEGLIAEFPSWKDFFWFDLRWKADEEEQKLYFQTFYNFITLKTNIHNFSAAEANEFLGYLHSTRQRNCKFLTNLENPFKPSLPSDSWFDGKTEEISKTFGAAQELKILKGTANAQNSESGHTLIVLRPYDFSVYEKETG